MVRATLSCAAAPSADAVPARSVIEAAIAQATRTVAPLWPLEHFVAVNPFLGLADRSFWDAACTLADAAGATMTMPRRFYVDAIRRGRITDEHLHEALVAARTAGEGAKLPADAMALRALVLSGDPPAPPPVFPTVADVVDRLTGQEWSRFLTDRLSFWASAYFDEGQASWRSPWRGRSPYAAWHAEASIDRTPEVMGARGYRAAVHRLPAVAADAAAFAVEWLGVPAAALDRYLRRLVFTLGGWAAYARYRVWERELRGGTDDTLVELLAVRLANEVALLEAFAGLNVREAWTAAVAAIVAAGSPPGGDGLAVDLVLQHAYEMGWQEQLVARIGSGTPAEPDLANEAPARPTAQAVFCIDVRSEVFRRALESVGPGVETIGFAGFFGFPIEYVPIGQQQGGAQCPVLLTPRTVIAETVAGAPGDRVAEVGALRLRRRRIANAWKAFKQGAISCFAFVGPVGLAYARKLVTDGLGLTRPVPHPASDGIANAVRAKLKPTLEPAQLAGRATGLPPADRLAMAEAVLKAMSLTGTFARLVLLAGHGSTTVNNPHATGLDCGACGGHTGEANARVAAAVLNDPGVRAGLAIPGDTVFLAGLHDTTTDQVTLFDEDAVPASHREDLARLKEQLAAAGRVARAERAPALKIAVDHATDARVIARSRDWSQVRPEWGLAGCAAFIAAPRHRTKGRDLRGRAFLHSYAWRQDEDFGVLELIMTAPMVVASWISLQYYGSTVDNRTFGSGNKTLHNVVGTLGVLEGNGGDLRTGLPWQSVHDGERYVHEPLRLDVVIEAPLDAMNAIIAKHEHVRALLDNGWVNLWALDDTGVISHRYTGRLTWSPVRAAVGLAA
jgi:uncharacterized protein YbcC (UPF0753/DUF2309 family)